MPPMENSASGNTSEVRQAGAGGERLLARTRRRGTHRRERVGADAAETLGHREHAHERQDEDRALEEQRGAVDDDRPLDAGAGRQPGRGRLVVHGDEHHGEERADQPDEGDGDLDRIPRSPRARRPRRARPMRANPKTIRSGRSARVVERRRRRTARAARVTASGAHFALPFRVDRDDGRRVDDPHVAEGGRHRRVDHVEGGLRVEAEDEEQGDERGHDPLLSAAQVTGARGALGDRSGRHPLVHQQDVERGEDDARRSR